MKPVSLYHLRDLCASEIVCQSLIIQCNTSVRNVVTWLCSLNHVPLRGGTNLLWQLFSNIVSCFLHCLFCCAILYQRSLCYLVHKVKVPMCFCTSSSLISYVHVIKETPPSLKKHDCLQQSQFALCLSKLAVELHEVTLRLMCDLANLISNDLTRKYSFSQYWAVLQPIIGTLCFFHLLLQLIMHSKFFFAPFIYIHNKTVQLFL